MMIPGMRGGRGTIQMRVGRHRAEATRSGMRGGGTIGSLRAEATRSGSVTRAGGEVLILIAGTRVGATGRRSVMGTISQQNDEDHRLGRRVNGERWTGRGGTVMGTISQ
eukprot:Hpha_TRINITY_DN21195_c0_g1::TRINITY_DN21195_c0_g1_i1::g.25230::m.25230